MGNGFNVLDLTKDSEDKIVQNYALDKVTYQAGRGPINVKVIDPLNVVAGEFELRFLVTLPDPKSMGAVMDTCTWEITNLTTGEKVSSRQAINVGTEQIFPEWGISVNIEQHQYTVFPGNLRFTPLIESNVVYDDPNHQWLSGVSDLDGLIPQNWVRSGTAEISSAQDPCGARYNDRIGFDDGQEYEKVVNGTWAPYVLAALSNLPNTDGCEPNHGLVSSGNINIKSQYEASGNDTRHLVSVDIVFTPDKSKWSRCVVLESQQDQALAGGTSGVQFQYMKNKPSIDKNGRATGTPGCNEAEATLVGTTGMGWFPGYAIDLETGERMNIAYAEDSWLGADNGNDMMFNPTSRMYSSLGEVIFGGKHYVYIFRNTAKEVNNPNSNVGMVTYDQGAFIHTAYATNNNSQIRRIWASATWAGIPMVASGESFLSNRARVRIRVAKPYNRYSTNGYSINNTADMAFSQNDWVNLYQFRTHDKAITYSDEQEMKDSILDLINIVPNPYYAYSNYEENRLDNRVKITNLPEVAKIKIYTINGTLVRTLTKDSPITSVDWDLKNFQGIPIASGAYLIHIDVPDVGEKVLKWFGVIRPPDLDNF